MDIFLGIDLGAGSLKATLIAGDRLSDGQNALLASASAPVETYQPAPGHIEQNPQDWRRAMQQALAELTASHAEAMRGLTGIAFSGGAHIGVLCDGAGAPLRPAIMWSDLRAATQARQLHNDGTCARITGNRPNATWTLPQLRWLAENEADILAKCQKLYFAKDWLRAQLTGDHATDMGEVVGAMMNDAVMTGWDDNLLALSGLEKTALPQIMSPGAMAGRVTPAAATAFGLPANVPVYVGSIDTSTEWLCCAPLSATTASLKLASAGVLSFGARAASTTYPPVSRYPHILDDCVYHAAGMSNCTGALEWVRQNWLGGMAWAQMTALAATARPGAAGVRFYPYLNGERAPLWRTDICAALTGLTRATSSADLARAAFEGVSFALREIWLDMTAKLPDRPQSLHVLGGGAANPLWLQMLADILNMPLVCGQYRDASFATALLAAQAHGRFDSLSQAADLAYREQAVFLPDKAQNDSYDAIYADFIARRHLTGTG
ncbi:MAG: xylulokinase [Parvibaculales bacterium]